MKDAKVSKKKTLPEEFAERTSSTFHETGHSNKGGDQQKQRN